MSRDLARTHKPATLQRPADARHEVADDELAGRGGVAGGLVGAVDGAEPAPR